MAVGRRYAGEAVNELAPVVSIRAGSRHCAIDYRPRGVYTVESPYVAIEGAVRQTGRGFYVKGDYSQTFGQHWRMTLAGVGLAGDEDDFLGQYHRNSHGSIALRFSF